MARTNNTVENSSSPVRSEKISKNREGSPVLSQRRQALLTPRGRLQRKQLNTRISHFTSPKMRQQRASLLQVHIPANTYSDHGTELTTSPVETGELAHSPREIILYLRAELKDKDDKIQQCVEFGQELIQQINHLTEEKKAQQEELEWANQMHREEMTRVYNELSTLRTTCAYLENIREENEVLHETINTHSRSNQDDNTREVWNSWLANSLSEERHEAARYRLYTFETIIHFVDHGRMQAAFSDLRFFAYETKLRKSRESHQKLKETIVAVLYARCQKDLLDRYFTHFKSFAARSRLLPGPFAQSLKKYGALRQECSWFFTSKFLNSNSSKKKRILTTSHFHCCADLAACITKGFCIVCTFMYFLKK